MYLKKRYSKLWLYMTCSLFDIYNVAIHDFYRTKNDNSYQCVYMGALLEARHLSSRRNQFIRG